MSAKVTLIVFLASIGNVFSQGQVVFHTHGIGQSGFVRFSNTVTHTWAYGDIVAGLYWGAEPASITNLVLPFAGLVGPELEPDPGTWGFVFLLSGGGNRYVGRSGIPTYFQVRTWSGDYDSWEAAFSTGDPNVLVSVLSQSPIAVTRPSATAGEPPPGIPWGGTLETPIIVEMVPVPEPSVWLLGALGAWLLLRLGRLKYRAWVKRPL